MTLLKWLGQPWLTFNRVLTTRVLESQVRKPAGATPYSPVPRSMLYVAASALPYH
jgi:hypothetical protein